MQRSFGSAGAVARWYALNDELWPEAAALCRRLSVQPQLREAVDSVTLQFEEAKGRSKDGLLVLDPALPDLFPQQKVSPRYNIG